MDLFHKSSCWERQTLSDRTEIPALTRVALFSASPEDRTTGVPPWTHAVPMWTPLTKQLLGHVRWSCAVRRVVLTTDPTQANCFVVPERMKEWQMGVYTDRHIRSHEPCYVWSGVAENDVAMTHDSTYPRVLGPWLPSCAWSTPQAQALSHYLLSTTATTSHRQGPCGSSSSMWRSTLLVLAVRVMSSDDGKPVHWLVDEFNAVHGGGRNLFPLVLSVLFLEGMYNSNVNRDWYLFFTVKFMENVRSVT
jgi:hypothetical protein